MIYTKDEEIEIARKNLKVFPRYDETKQKELLDDYRKIAKHEVKEITDDGLLIVGG